MSDRPPQTAEPVELDYAKPVRRHGLFPWWGGLICSAMFATGAGMATYGVVSNSSDAKNFLAAGIGFLAFGLGLLLTFIFSRR